MTIKDLQTRIDQLVTKAETALANARIKEGSSTPSLQNEDWAGLRAAGLAFIESAFGREHSYYREFDVRFKESWEYHGKYALGVLRAIQEQIRGGWLETTKGLVTAEVFADFIEMAEHLLDERYKDPAAVVVGSVLEEHLRQLCLSAGIPTEDVSATKVVPHKADRLNADLAKGGKYSKLDQKQITAWLDLRNKAAHGKYSEYSQEQVALMLAGVRDFLVRVRP
jgi:hypothetical protein